MEHEPLGVIGRQVFCLLVTLLRPIIRVAGGGLAIDLRTGRRFGLRQQGEIVLSGGASFARLAVTQTLMNSSGASLHAAFTLALPRGTAVSELTVGGCGRVSRAGVGERWAVRQELDATRLGGGSAALVSEDAPGIFSYEVAGIAPGNALTTTLQADVPGEADFTDALGLCLRVRFEAEPPALAAAVPQRRLMRLGTSQLLDAVIGIVHRRAAQSSGADTESIGADPSGFPALKSEALRGCSREDAASTTDVFVTCERRDGAGAAFRGFIADRPVRLVLDLQRHARGAGNVPRRDAGAAEVAQLLTAYEATGDEVTRQQLAERITGVGLTRRYATLWTSLLAIGNPAHDRDGERAQAVAS
jgi:hypothetical protein